MKIIGLTGGIGSGKSTVAGILGEMGARVIDADKLGHVVMRYGTPAWQEMINVFGREILTPQNEIDRNKLGKIVFNNPEQLNRLNRITHPLILNVVKARLEEFRRENMPVAVLEAILLIEAGWTYLVDEIWVTVAPEQVVLQRLRQRNNYSEDESLMRIRSQSSDTERLKHADIVINTDCKLEKLRGKLKRLWEISIQP